MSEVTSSELRRYHTKVEIRTELRSHKGRPERGMEGGEYSGEGTGGLQPSEASMTNFSSSEWSSRQTTSGLTMRYGGVKFGFGDSSFLTCRESLILRPLIEMSDLRAEFVLTDCYPLVEFEIAITKRSCRL